MPGQDDTRPVGAGNERNQAGAFRIEQTRSILTIRRIGPLTAGFTYY